MPGPLEVATSLEAYAAGPSSAQLILSRQLGVTLEAETPFPVAAARLRASLRSPLELGDSTVPATSGQIEYLEALFEELDLPSPITPTLTLGEADGWVKSYLAVRSARALRQWEPDVGDVVNYVRSGETRTGLVSSLGPSGMVYMRGIGQRTRPEQIVSVEHSVDVTADRRNEVISLEIADRPRSTRVDHSRMNELSAFKIGNDVSQAAVAAFDDALESADRERPMQLVLEQHPELLGRLIQGHHGHWVIPQVQFSNVYMADFLLAGATSAGMEWTLVELERPNVNLFNLDGSFTTSVIHAVRQVEDWREWIGKNALLAQQSRREGGLGLPYLRPASRALVVLGRSDEGFEDTSRYRLREFESRGIAIRTYDWLRRTMNLSSYDGAQLDREHPPS